MPLKLTAPWTTKAMSKAPGYRGLAHRPEWVEVGLEAGAQALAVAREASRFSAKRLATFSLVARRFISFS